MPSPRFSVIVPTFRRPRQLRACLAALAELDPPDDGFEVIVVDDGGEAAPAEIVDEARRQIGVTEIVDEARRQIDVTLLVQEHRGPAAARNQGIARARGEFLAFTDDDCLPDRGWLRALAARLEEAPDRGVGGRTLNGLPENLYSTASQLISDYVYWYYNREPGRVRFLASNNLAMPKEALRAVGGFDPSFRFAAEDRELCDRWLHWGYSLAYAPAAIVQHVRPLDLRGFWRQHFQYGRGACSFYRARARRGASGPRPEPEFHLNATRHILRRAPRRWLLPLLGLLVIWEVANVAGYLAEWHAAASRRGIT